MANTNRVNGFRPCRTHFGAPHTGRVGIYEVPAGETVRLYIGDPVILSNSASTSGYPAVEALAASASGDYTGTTPLVGFVVGVVPQKVDPVDGRMTTGSMSLDLPIATAGSAKQFVLVCDDPTAVFEAQADGAMTLDDIGLNVSMTCGTHNTTTGASAWQVDASSAATTSTLPLVYVGVPKRPDNEPNATYNKVLVRINTHQWATGGQRDVASTATIGTLGV